MSRKYQTPITLTMKVDRAATKVSSVCRSAIAYVDVTISSKKDLIVPRRTREKFLNSSVGVHSSSSFAIFHSAKEELEWTPTEKIKNSSLVLLGTTRSFRDKIVTLTYATADLHTDETFAAARSAFIGKVTRVRYSHDIMLHNLNHTTHKPHWQPVLEHHR